MAAAWVKHTGGSRGGGQRSGEEKVEAGGTRERCGEHGAASAPLTSSIQIKSCRLLPAPCAGRREPGCSPAAP